MEPRRLSQGQLWQGAARVGSSYGGGGAAMARGGSHREELQPEQLQQGQL